MYVVSRLHTRFEGYITPDPPRTSSLRFDLSGKYSQLFLCLGGPPHRASRLAHTYIYATGAEYKYRFRKKEKL